MNAPLSPTFRLYAKLVAFAKASAEDGSTMGIGGIVSTEALDRQQERVLADGLDFANFLEYGWFNDNHGQSQGDILGYPKSVKRVKPGDILPNGETAKVHGWWAEGYLLDTPKGRECWANVEALTKTPRGLGFSIEGKVTQRRPGGIVARADVTNVAITHVPVNPETGVVALAKALTAGAAVDSGDIGTGPGDGGALRSESLDGKRRPKVFPPVDFYGAVELDEDGAIVKAGTGGPLAVPAILERQHVESWADSLAYGLTTMGTPDNVVLSKAEARIVARADCHSLRGADAGRIPFAGASR